MLDIVTELQEEWVIWWKLGKRSMKLNASEDFGQCLNLRKGARIVEYLTQRISSEPMVLCYV
jgi:hypothetical protein